MSSVNIGPAVAVPAVPAPAPLLLMLHESYRAGASAYIVVTHCYSPPKVMQLLVAQVDLKRSMATPTIIKQEVL